MERPAVFAAEQIRFDRIAAHQRGEADIEKHADEIHLDKTEIAPVHLQRGSKNTPALRAKQLAYPADHQKKKERAQVEKYEKTINLADPYKLKANALALKNYSIWNRIQGITTPCLIFGATTDKLHSTEKMKRLIELIPEVQYIELASNTDTHSEKAGRIMVDYLGKKEYRNFSSRV